MSHPRWLLRMSICGVDPRCWRALHNVKGYGSTSEGNLCLVEACRVVAYPRTIQLSVHVNQHGILIPATTELWSPGQSTHTVTAVGLARRYWSLLDSRAGQTRHNSISPS